MRDIKFRFFDTNINKMRATVDGFDEGTGINEMLAWCQDSGLKVMQYTERKDKDGKEIYDGDIFRIEEDGKIECDFCDGTGTVEGGKYIESCCGNCNGSGIIEDNQDKIIYTVIVWVKEWCMFATLTIPELRDYEDRGIEGLDEPMFWTYTLEDTNSRKHFLCGNIYENPELI